MTATIEETRTEKAKPKKAKKPRKPKIPKEIFLIREDGSEESTKWKTLKEVVDWALQMKYECHEVGSLIIIKRPAREEYVSVPDHKPGEFAMQPRPQPADAVTYYAK
jgi:hypothetical protein